MVHPRTNLPMPRRCYCSGSNELRSWLARLQLINFTMSFNLLLSVVSCACALVASWVVALVISCIDIMSAPDKLWNAQHWSDFVFFTAKNAAWSSTFLCISISFLKLQRQAAKTFNRACRGVISLATVQSIPKTKIGSYNKPYLTLFCFCHWKKLYWHPIE